MKLALAGFCRHFEGDVQQKQDDQDQCCGNLNISANIPEIHFSVSLSSNTVKSKNIVPNKIFIVKAKNSFGVCGKSIFTPIKPPANQAADILIDRAESALSQYRGIFSTKASLIGGQMGVNQSFGKGRS